MRALFKAIVATAALAAPLYAHAIPMTWTFSGVCSGGNCKVGEQWISGTLIGDPNLYGDPGNLFDAVLFGEVLSYDFTVAGSNGHHFVGNDAAGQYSLDKYGNIDGGWMTFGSLLLNLTIGDLGKADWSYTVKDCIFCSPDTRAWGRGSYTTATSVPEPATLSLLGLGLLALGFAWRRRA